MAAVWNLESSLALNTRLRRAGKSQVFSASELLTLAVIGLLAACAEAWFHPSLRIPGHAILRAIFPMTLGLALVPRQFAGTMMSVFAGVAAACLTKFAGASIALPAAVSMILMGPCLDLLMLGSSHSQWIYARFAAAGVLANLAALAVKVIASLAGVGALNRPLASFLPIAIPSFVICGAIAGLLSGVVWFRSDGADPRGSEPS